MRLQVASESNDDTINLEIARRWCRQQGAGWSVVDQAGRGGTAPVFSVSSPDGQRALKIYDEAYSSGQKGVIEEKRVDHQKTRLGVHDCPYLVKIYDGGRFEGRLFVLMSRAPGRELEKRLVDVPRNKIRQIVDSVARACIFLREKGLCHRDIKSANIFISEDFEQVTLLDLSVMRDVHDPVGLGTDHGDQLPVVATARYSPPDYLFRLIEPSPALWHAVDVYQLGALLYDLIMRESLFEKEYKQSKDNRYRFAWAVATVHPEVHATDVDFDLILIARNALDKDWRRRSQLKIEDFLSDAARIQNNALNAIGFVRDGDADRVRTDEAYRLRKISDAAVGIEKTFTEHLRNNGITAEHGVAHADLDWSKKIYFRWSSDHLRLGHEERYEFWLLCSLQSDPLGDNFQMSAELRDSTGRNNTLELPSIADGPNAIEMISDSAKSALPRLAALMIRDRK
jgi:serine/threonine protein kinase